jgi:RHS repeat-associated protein
MLSDGANAFTWNARNQLATLNGRNLQYDANGRRIQNLLGTSFLYDGANAAQELSGGTVTANLLSGGIDEVFSRSDASGAFTQLQDALGSTIALADGNGNIQTSYTYDPFGNTSVSGTANANVYQYAGRENEGNGLYYYRARYYLPLLHRFINEDPLGIAGSGPNFYAYVGNNPTNFTDPLGLQQQLGQPPYWDCVSPIQPCNPAPKLPGIAGRYSEPKPPPPIPEPCCRNVPPPEPSNPFSIKDWIDEHQALIGCLLAPSGYAQDISALRQRLQQIPQDNSDGGGGPGAIWIPNIKTTKNGGQSIAGSYAGAAGANAGAWATQTAADTVYCVSH